MRTSNVGHSSSAALACALAALTVLATGCTHDSHAKSAPKPVDRQAAEHHARVALADTSVVFEASVKNDAEAARVARAAAGEPYYPDQATIRGHVISLERRNTGPSDIEDAGVKSDVKLEWYRPFPDTRLLQGGTVPAKGYSYCMSSSGVHRVATVNANGVGDKENDATGSCPGPATKPGR